MILFAHFLRAVGDILKNKIDKVRREENALRGLVVQRLRQSLLELLLSEPTTLAHPAKDGGLAAFGGSGVGVRIESRGVQREAGEQRGFGVAEVGEGLAKVVFCRAGYAEIEAPEI